MKTSLDFEKEETKKLLSKLNFAFFLQQNIEEENYNEEDVAKVYSKYVQTKSYLKRKRRKSRKQLNYYLEGQVRKMFTGGLLPALFHLDEGRGHTFLDFEGVGENYALFELWQQYYKCKITINKIWETVIKTGSILAIILSIMKIIEEVKGGLLLSIK